MDIDNLPLYEMVIDEEMDNKTGISFISLVENPAMESDFYAFNSIVEYKFDKAKQELVGALIVPDKKIPRNVPGMGQFNVIFSKDTIKSVLEKFQRNNFNNNINLFHSEREVNGFLTEVWIKEFAEDKSNAYGLNLPIGSLIGKVKILDEQFWRDYVETKAVKGFSIEILSGVKQLKMHAEDPYEMAFQKIQSILEKFS